MKRFVALFLVLGMVSIALASPVRVASPDGRIVVTVDVRTFKAPVPPGSYLSYQIEAEGKTVVEPSPIRLELKGAPALGLGVKIEDVSKRSIDETSELLYGKTRFLRNHCNELLLLVRETKAPHRFFYLTVRAYNDGAAWRLTLPRQPQLANLAITQERTAVCLSPGTAYVLPLKLPHTGYENNYQVLKTSDIPQDMLIGLPMLVHLDAGPWVEITEAALVDYAGLYLKPAKGAPGSFVGVEPTLPDDKAVCAKLTTPHDLPWRVFLIADGPGHFIESNLIFALNDRSQIERPCWIRPGKVAWPWWSGRTVEGRSFRGGMNTQTMKYYIDFAADAGLEYLLIDAGWYGDHRDPNADITTTIPEIDMPEILDYAQMRGVGVLLWVNWQCVDRQMDEAFPLYEKWGVKGVKVDYMNRDDQEMVNFYRRVVEKAAQHHLVVDFHGAYKPTGLSRLYPNLLTREGVLGLEYSKWSRKCSPEHELMIPYLRMVAGPMDFTPGAFNVGNQTTFRPRANPPMAQGTRAHQLAMYVVYYSPLQMLVDHPASYWGQTGFEFLKVVPTVWDDTKFIAGEVGDYVVVARRASDDWYLGAMTDWTARDLSIPLAFLGEGRFLAQIYEDAPDADRVPTHVQARLREVTPSDTLRVHLAPGGGCAVRFLKTWDQE